MDIEILKKQQIELAKRVILQDGFAKITTVGRFDVSYSGKRFFCSGVIMEWGKGKNYGFLNSKPYQAKKIPIHSRIPCFQGGSSYNQGLQKSLKTGFLSL